MSGRHVPAALRSPLGDEGTFALIELLDHERSEWSEKVLNLSVERFERRLTGEISGMREAMLAALRDERTALYDGLGAVRQELSTTRVELLKWSFLFWVGQVAAMAALLAALFRFTGR